MAGKPQPKGGTKAKARRRPIAGRAPRREAEHDAVWWAGQVATEAYRARCAARGVLSHRCGDLQDGVDPQHVIPRGVRRDLASTVANIVPLCREAHRWVDHHPNEAWELGWHRYSWEVPMPRPASLVATLPHEDGTRRGSVEQPAATPAEVCRAIKRLAPFLPPDVTWSYRNPHPPEAEAEEGAPLTATESTA